MFLRNKRRNGASLRRFLTGAAFFPISALPWRKEAEVFLDHCKKKQCYQCIDLCPEKVLVPTVQGLPAMDFSKNGCSFCGKCATVCPENLFFPITTKPWDLVVSFVKEDCVAFANVHCRSCEEVCDQDAISFIAQDDGSPSKPSIDLAKCNGCGKCVAPCMTGALRVTSADKLFFLQ